MSELSVNIADLLDWNDRHNIELSDRFLKITEENGEVADAWLGFRGGNPRKGVTNGIEKVWQELSDVAITALVAIASTGGDPEHELHHRLQFVLQRLAEEAP